MGPCEREGRHSRASEGEQLAALRTVQSAQGAHWQRRPGTCTLGAPGAKGVAGVAKRVCPPSEAGRCWPRSCWARTR